MLADSPDKSKISDGEIFSQPYFGKPKYILNLVDRCEKRTGLAPMLLYHTDLEVLWSDFQSLFKLIDAAGGLVRDSAGQLLFIYRRGFWDLPKGKVDRGETIPQAALREVQEETGLKAVLGHEAAITLHTYRTKKGKRVLKTTYWFHMSCDHPNQLQLQREEDIEEALWLTDKWQEQDLPTPLYRSIRDMLIQTVM